MLIKKNQLNNDTHPAKPDRDGQGGVSKESSSQGTGGRGVVPLPWTQEGVDQGLVADRRQAPQEIVEAGPDRRGGYRRVEDRTLISRAHEEANAIRENAQQVGFQEGLEQATEAIEALQASFDQLIISRNEALASLADDIAPIAVEIAERIIKTEISCDEELVTNIVHDTLQKVGRQTKSILIKVNPNDVDRIKQSLKNTPFSNPHVEMLVMDDPSIDQGGCIVETNSGLIDASFSTRLEILKKLFGTSESIYGAPKNETPSGDG